MRLPAEVKRVLDGRCFGHLATLQPDGGPKVEPVWLGREGERVLVATDERTLKGAMAYSVVCKSFIYVCATLIAIAYGEILPDIAQPDLTVPTLV